MLLHVNYTWAGREKKSENTCELKYVLNGKKLTNNNFTYILLLTSSLMDEVIS